MTTDRDPTFEDKPIEQASAHPPIRVEPRSSGQIQSSGNSGPGLGTILTSCFLALVMGGVGAWAYVDYLGPMIAKRQAQKSQTEVQKSESDALEPKAPDVTARLKELSGKLDDLESRVARLPKAVSAQDLEPLKERVAVVEELSRKVDALGLRVGSLPGKVDQDSRKITTLAADLVGMRNEVDSLRNNLSTTSVKEPPSSKTEMRSARAETSPEQVNSPRSLAASEPPREIPPPVKSMLQGGIEFFQSKHYDEASEFFSSLTKAQMADARVWYYAALSRGLATRDWKGETERLVTKGVELEKAGKPDKEKINAAFTNLTSETGQDWLAFYRRKAE